MRMERFAALLRQQTSEPTRLDAPIGANLRELGYVG